MADLCPERNPPKGGFCMGQTNAKWKHYCSNKKRFADLFNGTYFKGKNVIRAEELQEGSEVYCEPEAYRNWNEKEKTQYVERIRDVKMLNGNGRIFRVLAVENQQAVDYSMPFRCMQYDTLQYQSQLDEIRSRNEVEDNYQNAAERLCRIKKKDRLWPVYTLCLYLGEDKWDGPRSLRDMMQFEEEDELREYFADYPFRLYCLNEEQDYSVFHTELRKVFELLSFRKDKKGMLGKLRETPEYQKLDSESLEILAELLKIPTVWKNRQKYLVKNAGEEEYDMCQAIEELIEDGRNEGRIEGKQETLLDLVRDGLLRLEEAAKRLNLAPEELAKLV